MRKKSLFTAILITTCFMCGCNDSGPSLTNNEIWYNYIHQDAVKMNGEIPGTYEGITVSTQSDFIEKTDKCKLLITQAPVEDNNNNAPKVGDVIMFYRSDLDGSNINLDNSEEKVNFYIKGYLNFQQMNDALQQLFHDDLQGRSFIDNKDNSFYWCHIEKSHD